MKNSVYYKQLADELKQLDATHRLRTLSPVSLPSSDILIHNGMSYLNFASNDYLGYAQYETHSQQKGEDRGSTASIHICGYSDLQKNLEDYCANWLGMPASILFGSGYLANLGVLPALMHSDDVIFSDALNHASIIDGCRMANATVEIYNHLDMNHLEHCLKQTRHAHRHGLIVSESVFSMDGDIAPVRSLVNLAQKYGCLLYIDEAHGVGVFGKQGSGVVADQGCVGEVDLILGTFGKALGSYGAVVGCREVMRHYLVNKVRSLMFTTGLPQDVLARTWHNIDRLGKQSWKQQKLWANLHYLSWIVTQNALPISIISPIIPIIVGTDVNAIALASYLEHKRIFCVPIRPPTVPEGSARIRITISASHRRSQLDYLVEALVDWFSNFQNQVDKS